MPPLGAYQYDKGIYTFRHVRVNHARQFKTASANAARTWNVRVKLARAANSSQAPSPISGGRRNPSSTCPRARARARGIRGLLLGSKVATTAFRDEEKLTVKDRDFIQNVIDTMVNSKK